MKYKLVIFDLDGTILYTLEDLKQALNHALTAFGYPNRTLEEVRCFVGNGIRKLIKRALPEGTDDEIIDAIKSITLEKVRAAYPEFEVIGRSIAKSNTKRPYLRVSYAYMERYIANHEKAEERMKEYQEMRFRSECHEVPFSEVKKWFIACYPEIDDFTPEDFKRECSSAQIEENNCQSDKLASGF